MEKLDFEMGGILVAVSVTDGVIGVAFAAVACVTLAACSMPENLPPMQPYVPPSMPTTTALIAGVKQAAAEAKLLGPIEMSDLRPTDHGPGHFMLCIHGVSNDFRTGFYAAFFDDVYKGSRLPAMFDNCEKQNYRPVP